MFTVLGAGGFIGSELVRFLQARGIPFHAPGRHESVAGRTLGHIVYCVGLTADFRTRPLETVDAHVGYLRRLLEDSRFDSLTYLSSTRLYGTGSGPTDEEAAISLRPQDPDHLYNASKAMGESLLLSSGRPARVVRLSNVYGPDFTSQNFLSAIVREAVESRRVVLRTALESEKDYVNVADVVALLPRIAEGARDAIYNVARGTNVTNRQLVERLATLTGCEVETTPNAPIVRFPPIDTTRVRREFDFRPRDVVEDLPELVKLYESGAMAS